MIDPSECFVAPISAAKSMTLVLPRTTYEYRCLIVTVGEKPVVVCLDEYPQLGRFLAFECQNNESWKGLHLPGVRIELDETSLHDAERHFAPLGSMVRIEGKLALQVRFEGNHQGSYATIYDGLPMCPPYMSACFLKWQIVLGEAETKRVLWRENAALVAS